MQKFKNPCLLFSYDSSMNFLETYYVFPFGWFKWESKQGSCVAFSWLCFPSFSFCVCHPSLHSIPLPCSLALLLTIYLLWKLDLCSCTVSCILGFWCLHLSLWYHFTCPSAPCPRHQFLYVRVRFSGLIRFESVCLTTLLRVLCFYQYAHHI